MPTLKTLTHQYYFEFLLCKPTIIPKINPDKTITHKVYAIVSPDLFTRKYVSVNIKLTKPLS